MNPKKLHSDNEKANNPTNFIQIDFPEILTTAAPLDDVDVYFRTDENGISRIVDVEDITLNDSGLI